MNLLTKNHPFSNPKKILSVFIIGSILIRIAHTLAKAAFIDPNSYQFSEFLINFEGGFVRRGFLGQLLYWFCEYTQLSPFPIISAICLIAWVIFLCFFFKKFKHLGYCWWFLASPLFWGPPGSVIRKDYLCYLVIIAMLYIVKSCNLNTLRTLALFLLGTFGMFLHEAFVFFGIPIIGLALISQKRTRIKGIIFSLVGCLLFLMFSYFKGSTDIVNSILNSWNTILGRDTLIYTSNSIEALGKDAVTQFKFHIYHNLHEYNDPSFGWAGIILRPLFAIASYYLIVNFIFIFKEFSPQKETQLRTSLSILYIFSLLCLTPMFTFLSCDYGRLYQYAVVPSLAALIILPEPILTGLFPKRLKTLVERFNNKMNELVIPSKGLMIILLVILAPTPSCFTPWFAFESSILGNYCNVLNILFVKLLNIFPQ